jgi:hypothetical protein
MSLRWNRRHFFLGLSAAGAGFAAAFQSPAQAPPQQPGPSASLTIPTGPAVGTRIPNFEAVDQSGRTRRFDDLRGPKGLALMFVRSADW